MKKGMKIAIIVVGVACVVGVGTLYAVRKEPWLSSSAAFNKGEECMKRGAYSRAFRYVKMAANKDPKDPKFSMAAARMASATGDANAAFSYAQKAWKAGRKDRDVLGILVRFSFYTDKQQKLAYALSLVKEMGQSANKDDILGDVYMIFGMPDSARVFWEQQYKCSPLPGTASKLAQAYLQLKNEQLGCSFFQSCRDQGKLDDEGVGVLARLYTKMGNIAEADKCYKEAMAASSSPEKLQYDHALFLLEIRNYSTAARTLDSLIAKYPDNKNLETMRMSVFLAQNDPAGALAECEKSKAPLAAIGPLKARAFVMLKRFDEAEAAYDSAMAHKPGIRIMLEYGNFLLTAANKRDKAQAVFKSVLAIAPKEPVSNIGLAILALEEKKIAEARSYINVVQDAKVNIPLVHQILAEICLVEGNFKEALQQCDKALVMQPALGQVRILKISALDKLGRLNEAWSLLDSMRNQRGISKEQESYLNRISIPLLVRRQNYPEALKLLDEFEKSNPAEETGRIRLEIYAFSKDVQKARETLAAIKPKLKENEYLYYESWLLDIEGKHAEAAAVLESHLQTKNFLMRWASLRLKAGNTQGVMEKLPFDSLGTAEWSILAAIADKNNNNPFAAECYKKALLRDKKNAALLNNYAYACVQTPGFDQKEVLTAIQNAYQVLPTKTEILQTYAEVLNKCEKPAKCIALLRDKPALAKQNVGILYQLGLAYEATGDVRGAVSSYRLMLGFPPNTANWPGGVTLKDLEAKVAALSAKLGKS